jgi:subtilisin-like proprotein convertase family protein
VAAILAFAVSASKKPSDTRSKAPTLRLSNISPGQAFAAPDKGVFPLDAGTFSGGAFTIPDNTMQDRTVVVSGLTGTITVVTVTLNFTSSVRPDDLDFLLVHPDGSHNLEFLSDGGGTSAIGALTLTLSDAGATCVPDPAGWVTNTTYRPADYSGLETGTNFGVAAVTVNPAGPGCVGANGTATFATAFSGLTANGTWHLYARDDASSGDAGSAISSWSISVTTQAATATVGNFVFDDLNGNGIQNVGEPGISGVTVKLLNSPALTQAAITTTASGGLYSFSGVTPGNYVIEFTAPAGFIFSPKDQGADDTLDSDANTGTGRTDQFALAGGASDLTRDAGMIGTYVGDRVFGDINANGIQDGGENGISGVTVRLLDNSNATVGTTTTGTNGSYRFLVTTAGNYSIEFVPSTYSFSPQDQGGNDTLDSDANPATGRTAPFAVTIGVPDSTRDAGMFLASAGTTTLCNPTITISDNASGFATVSTPYPSTISVGGLSGTISKVTVTISGFSAVRPDDVDMLLVGPTGASLIVWSDLGGNSAGSATITMDDSAVNFIADNPPLASGTFKPTNESTVQDAFAAPAPLGPYGNPGGATAGAGPDNFASKFNSTSPNGDWKLYVLDDAVSNDAGGSITSWCLNITTQATTALIGDFVFEDTNNNGIQDAGEAGINGVTVRLLNSPALTQAATTTTSGGGAYTFANVTPGNYVVEFTAPAGYIFSPKDQGADDTKDSDVNTGTGRTDQFAVVAGQIDSSRDAGLVGTYVGDRVFGDTNHNGIQDGGESGITGVTVRLLNSGNATVGTTTTGANGFYRFLVTTAGNYSVEFVLPAGFTFSPQDQGGNDTLDSDANVGTGRTVQFPVVIGVSDATRDAGMFTSAVGTFTFTGSGIAITDHDGSNNATVASPYPSTIFVGGLLGAVSKVTVTINGFTAPRPDDVDMLLVDPSGHALILWSDIGGNSTGSATITLDDAAAALLPDSGPLVNGNFKPTNQSTVQDPFPAIGADPPPTTRYSAAPGGAASLAMSIGVVPNGTWKLYVLDDAVSGDAGGSITSWAVNITTTTAPTASSSVVTGRIVDDKGQPVEGAVVLLEGTQNRKFITDANGVYLFENVETNGFYTVTPSRANYIFNPAVRSFSQLGEKTEAAFGATLNGGFANPLDTPEYFVRQQYLDFLGREPDEAGFNFWSDQILECEGDADFVERRKENVSAAFFLSIEFQETGGLIDGLYRASFGVPPQFAEFKPDTGEVARGVVVGRAGWQATLESNKQVFIEAFVSRPDFQAQYAGLSNTAYVDTLIMHTGVTFPSNEREALVSGLTAGTLTRATALRSIAEQQRYSASRFNEAFVMMEYFGYLRRDPDAQGYEFWLNKLNQFSGNFEQAEMVKAFLVSTEYRERFPK